jgi:hypothetical protein
MAEVITKSSLEAEIDRKLESLIDKIVRGEATQDDRYAYESLSVQRSQLMMPSALSRLERLQRRKAAA